MPNYIKADQFSTHTEFVVAVTWNLWMASLVNYVEQIPEGS